MSAKSELLGQRRAFIDTVVTGGSGGLDDPNLMTFTQTDR